MGLRSFPPDALGGKLKDRLIGLVCRALALFFRSPPPELPREASFLVIKPCCLGDVLFATPALAALRRAYPEARIDFAVGRWARTIVEHNPHVDGIVDCGPVGSGRYGLSDYLRLMRKVRQERYTCALVLDRSPWLSVLPYLAGIPIRAGLDSGGRGFSLTHSVPVEPMRHEAELYLDVVRALGVSAEGVGLTFLPDDAERKRVQELGGEIGLSLPKADSLVLIHPGGGENPGMVLPAKRWPVERLAVLAERLMERAGARVILVGGPEDGALARTIQEQAAAGLSNLVGRLSLGELAALMEHANLYIGHDTGATHLAVAMGTPTIALFGPSDPARYGPYGSERAVALWKRLECSPCFTSGRYDASCREPRCIEAISLEDVWREVERLLASSGQ
jgi:lipopolysaccharide heptosyltransferase II